MLNRFLEDIIDYCELTHNSKDKTYIMNKYTRIDKEYYNVDEEIALCLIQSEVLEHTSGNWETGDKHYVLGGFRKDKIKKINYMLEQLDEDLYLSDKVKFELLNMKNKQKRLLKIKRLNKV
jgi:hypothetical protein